MDEVYLRGARKIAEELEHMGVIRKGDPNAEDKVYHLVRSGQIEVGLFAGQYITTVLELRAQIAKQIA
jgi:hypothetical protein